MKHADTRAKEAVQAETVDPATQEGRETIIEQISELPEELLLSALNRKAVST